MKTELKVIRPAYGEENIPRLAVNKLEMLGDEASFAASMIERWGLVQGVPDGEDSVGRSKLALMSPTDLVDRACNTAEVAFAEFHNRGWVKTMPTFDEMENTLKDQEDKN